MVERPAREAPPAVIAERVAGDVAMVFEFMEIADDRGAGDLSLQRSHQVRGTEGAAVLGQRDHDGEFDAVHAHADQRVQLDGEWGVGVGRHAPIVSVACGKGRRDTMSNLCR